MAVVLVSAFVGERVSAVSLKQERAEFDAKVVKELRAVNPQAADLFAQANQAREREDHVRARDLYQEVRALVPDSPHPARREAMEELALENRPRALELARAAVALDPSADDLSCLAIVLSSGKEATEAEHAEALDAARRAAGLEPDNFYAQAALAQAAILGNDLENLESAAARMTELAPEEAGGYYFTAIAQASHQEIGKAEESLAEARRKGLPEADYQAMLQGVREARPWYSGLGTRAAETVVVWAGGLLLLLGLGALLSRATLRAATRMPSQGIGGTGQASGSDLALRRLYKGVLWLSCLYYWLSIPIVSLLVVVIGGGLIYGIFAMGYVPIKLVVIIVAVVFVTLGSIVKSLFVRGRDEDPGLKLAPAEEPRLRDLLHEVAARIGTRPVDNVYLTPGTELAVMERGGMLKQLRGSSERCLILGVGVLDGLKIGPFKAILAHEYGHFSNQDTAGGGFALSVRRSLYRMAVHLAQGGAAAWYNPAWLFVIGFQRVFLRISQGASRLQEILADRWAAFAYGPAFFEQGLRHVIRRGILFDAHANATLSEVVEAKAALANLYSYQPAKQPDAVTVASELETALTREPSPYDSHPSPVDRFRWTQALATTARPAPEDDQESWTLFRDREALERKLTGTIRENLLSQGFEIPAEAAAATA
jgi:Zn-dependent protease with chaperone function/tetratricopeptide (TPR) repeat protein